MTRFEDWPSRLHTFLEAARGRPFSWGRWDCCILAADAVKILTGSDPLTPFRGRYRSARGAVRLLKPLGGLVGGCTTLLGVPITPLLAQRGDVVLIEAPAGAGGPLACGVVDLTGRAVACPGETGLLFVPLARARHAWRIG